VVLLVVLGLVVSGLVVGVGPVGASGGPAVGSVPGVPVGVGAVGERFSAVVSWGVPSDGGSSLLGFRVEVLPGGRVVDVPVVTGSWVVDGLASGVPVSFRVAAVNGNGVGGWSVVSPVVVPLASGGLFRGVVPARVLDTREGLGAAKARVGAGSSVDVQIGGRGGVPVSGVGSVVLNVTAVGASAATHLTVWPAGEVRPGTSNVNVGDGAATPNLVEVKVGVGGKVSVFNNSGSVDVIFDVAGYVVVDPGSSVDGMYQPLAPKRILDTREGLGAAKARVGAGGSIDVQVSGVGGVPVSGVSAVVLNLTAVNPSAGTHVTVWPTGEGLPVASNLNVGVGEVRPNRVSVKVGSGGKVSLRNNS
jgi:hypothetical protein